MSVLRFDSKVKCLLYINEELLMYLYINQVDLFIRPVAIGKTLLELGGYYVSVGFL